VGAFVEVLKPSVFQRGPETQVLRVKYRSPETHVLRAKYRGLETQVLRAKCSNTRVYCTSVCKNTAATIEEESRFFPVPCRALQARAICVRPSQVPTSLYICKERQDFVESFILSSSWGLYKVIGLPLKTYSRFGSLTNSVLGHCQSSKHRMCIVCGHFLSSQD
jgi:hypothetical protein